MSTVINEVMGWLNAPFTEQLDIQSLFLMTGLVLVFILAWIMILYHVRLAAETV